MHLILLHRLANTHVTSVNVGIGKARTAAIYRRPSKEFEDQIKAGRIDGKAIGAIGVSGDTPQVDEAIAGRAQLARRVARAGSDRPARSVPPPK